MIDEIENLIKPEKQAMWPELRKKWFVIDFSDPRDLRFPGKMKTEWETKTGAMIAYVFLKFVKNTAWE
jgi:hypothetical protein